MFVPCNVWQDQQVARADEAMFSSAGATCLAEQSAATDENVFILRGDLLAGVPSAGALKALPRLRQQVAPADKTLS